MRSYLADKLNCDPMRITKKFTGACCLGRRVYHLRDRPRASPAEIEMARIELDHLEKRFRLRVEHDQSGLPLPPRQDILMAQPQRGLSALYPMQNPSATIAQPWFSSISPPQLASNSSLPVNLPASHPLQAVTSRVPGTIAQAPGQWLLPSNNAP